MKCLILSGNPKKDGLCHSVMEEVLRGVADAGGAARVLSDFGMERCRCCGDGWGICRDQNVCAFGGDGFDEAQAAVRDADCFCILTPVYWNEVSDGLKSFLDKLRRCEFRKGALLEKPVLLVASAGGSGNGLLPCLEQMDRFCRHTGAVIFDYIGINRWNSDYKRAAAYAAARAMAEGRPAGGEMLR